MSEVSFLSADARKQAVEAVKQIESVSAAEVVITVRPSSGDYRAADWLTGALGGFAALVLVVFLPQPFTEETIPLDVLVGFGLGALLSNRIAWVRRMLSSKETVERNVKHAARATFVDLGVTKTHRRNGVLVYVSLFEKSVEVVTDVGIDVAALGPSWTTAITSLQQAVGKGDFAGFRSALNEMSKPLAAVMPRLADDINELADDLGAT